MNSAILAELPLAYRAELTESIGEYVLNNGVRPSDEWIDREIYMIVAEFAHGADPGQHGNP